MFSAVIRIPCHCLFLYVIYRTQTDVHVCLCVFHKVSLNPGFGVFCDILIKIGHLGSMSIAKIIYAKQCALKFWS